MTGWKSRIDDYARSRVTKFLFFCFTDALQFEAGAGGTNKVGREIAIEQVLEPLRRRL